MSGLERAKADLGAGNVRKARERLKSLVLTYPNDLEIRRLLAEAYRLDRQFAEAGRWGYLIEAHASDPEREAFERHNAFASYDSRVSESRLRHLLRCEDLGSISDATGRALLRSLPRKRARERRDGPLEFLSRRLAMLSAQRRWR
ncbi:hypothetical protein Q9R32_10965 [Actinotalea sp. AC32]|nr:hypothetical protein [Actinotalea sp. AC32]